ncbi:amidase [Aliiroseovarius sp. PrR006]|nr:amidase [Aliiroseovarius sp. PrR006]
MHTTVPPNALSALDAARQIREGKLTSVELVTACLKRISETDEQLRAWVYVDADEALAQARELDEIRRKGRPTGPLHGVPVGIKDIIDAKGVACERGSPIFKGRIPEADAAIIERLREAGAVIMGKTVTTEFAFMHPAETRNPHNPDYSPGGSSSGSAAAVAAYHVPLAIGTQTNGSVIRPASYCGTYGFKPSRGVISRRGILQTSQSLDQVGVFARDLPDAALLADVIGGYDPTDDLSYSRPRPQMLAGSQAKAPVEPAIAYLDMPYKNRLSNDAREGFEELLETLGQSVERLPVDDKLATLIDAHATIHEYEIWQHNKELFTEHWDQLSQSIQPVLRNARTISAAAYEDALQVKLSGERFFSEFFNDYDAIIMPSSTGEAPLFETGTGDPIFSTISSLCGLPSLTMPLLVGANNMPVGVQLVGGCEEDDRLLRTASWMLDTLFI